jgi:hypothetical protein
VKSIQFQILAVCCRLLLCLPGGKQAVLLSGLSEPLVLDLDILEAKLKATGNPYHSPLQLALLAAD